MKPIEMLSAILQRGQITDRERESFEDMYDRIHRYKRCSDKQKAWIEKVYFGQKLDEEAPVVRRRVIIPTWQQRSKGSATPRVEAQVESREPKPNAVPSRPTTKTGTFLASPAVAKSHQVGYVNYPGVQREVPVATLSMFEEVCPRIRRGSRQYQKVADFFANGGVVVKVKPVHTAQVA